jgi:hypothetical protein
MYTTLGDESHRHFTIIRVEKQNKKLFNQKVLFQSNENLDFK